MCGCACAPVIQFMGTVFLLLKACCKLREGGGVFINSIGQNCNSFLVMAEMRVGCYIRGKKEEAWTRERANEGTADEYILHSWSLR